MWYLTVHRWRADQRTAIAGAIEDGTLARHLTWMREQQIAGRVLMAGPSPDRTLGIIVFGHLPEEIVHELCRSEPMVAAGHRAFEVTPWDVHHVLGIGQFELPEG
ncbi:YciI family protein [Actinoplanes sp. NPDC049265]|uniref:YciI family protein n=1 Tax=Actinoplanes sp. NPDC049265 TaxID=3363902 RepID=UPI003718DD37